MRLHNAKCRHCAQIRNFRPNNRSQLLKQIIERITEHFAELYENFTTGQKLHKRLEAAEEKQSLPSLIGHLFELQQYQNYRLSGR